jgi:Zn-dependent protease with chaperone function
MRPHPGLVKRFIWVQMVLMIVLVILGVFYTLGIWTNSSFSLVLDPAISYVATVAFTLFIVAFLWILVSYFVRMFSRKPVAEEMRERLGRLANETMRRMSFNQRLRLVVAKRSRSAGVSKARGGTKITVGERLLQEASDEEVTGILGHEMGHVMKKHLYLKGFSTLISIILFFVVLGEAGESRPSIILGVTVILAFSLAMIPLNWRLEYAADRVAAERLGTNPVISALERLRIMSFDGVSFTHPPLSRRIRRIQLLWMPPFQVPIVP